MRPSSHDATSTQCTCSVHAVHVHMQYMCSACAHALPICARRRSLYARLAPDDVAAAGAVGRVGGGGVDLKVDGPLLKVAREPVGVPQVLAREVGADDLPGLG